MTDRLHPFPGLRSFERDETAIFFGREDHIDELADRLAARHFLAITGSSGSGKSSVAKVGLLAALERGDMNAPHGAWRIAVFRPMDRPFENLADALLGAFAQPREEHDTARLAAALRRGPSALVDVVQRLGIEEHNVLILVDQFEELFTYEDLSAEASEGFINLLLHSVRLARGETGGAELPLYVALTMRSDFLGRCGDYEGLAEEINASQYLTPRMTREQVRSAIEGPARVFGGTVEPKLVNALLNEMGAKQDRLPLLQHALRLLWDGTPADSDGAREVKYHAFIATGGLEAALSEHADAIYRSLGSEARQAIAERLFRSLTDSAGDAQDTRRPVPLSEVMAITGASLDEIAPVVDAFRDRACSFLLPPPDRPLTPETVIDISHESLIRGWKRLREWTRKEAEAAQTYRDLARRAHSFQDGRGSPLTGVELAVARIWLAEQRPTAAWALRYSAPENAMDAVAEELRRIEKLIAAGEQVRRYDRWRKVVVPALAVALLLVIAAVWGMISAITESRQAELEAVRAGKAEDDANLQRDLAKAEAERAQKAEQEANEQRVLALAEKDRADKAAAQATRLQQQSDAAQQETLSQYQRYLAGIVGDERSENNLVRASWRQILALAWPDRLEADEDRRIPGTTLESMPLEYLIQLVLSRLDLLEAAAVGGGNYLPASTLDQTYIDASMVVDSTGRWLVAIVDQFRGLLVFDMQTGRGVKFTSTVDVDSLVAAPDGRVLFALRDAGVFALRLDDALLSSRLSDLSALELEFLEDDDSIGAATFTKDGSRLVTLGLGGGVTVRAWPQVGRVVSNLSPPEGPAQSDLPLGDLWTTAQPAEEQAQGYAIQPTTFGEDKYLLSLSSAGQLWLWDLREGAWAAQSKAEGLWTYALSDDEKYLVLLGSTENDDLVEVFELSTGKKLASFDTYLSMDIFGGQVIDVGLRATVDGVELRLLLPDGLAVQRLRQSDIGLDLDGDILWYRLPYPIAMGAVGWGAAVVAWQDRNRLMPFPENANLRAEASPLPKGSGTPRHIAVASDGSRAAVVENGHLELFELRPPRGHGPYFASIFQGDLPCLDKAKVVDVQLAPDDGPLALVGQLLQAPGRDEREASGFELCVLDLQEGLLKGGVLALGSAVDRASGTSNQSRGDEGGGPTDENSPDDEARQPLVAFSADGKTMAVLANETLDRWLFDTDPVGSVDETETCSDVPETSAIDGLSLRLSCRKPIANSGTAKDLLVGPDGTMVVAAFDSTLAVWDAQLALIDNIPVPRLVSSDETELELRMSAGGGYLLAVSGGETTLVDLCTRREGGRLLWTAPIVRTGFFSTGEALDGCNPNRPERHVALWVLEQSGLLSRWLVTGGIGSRPGGGTVAVDWVLLADHTDHVEALDEEGTFVVADDDVRIDRGATFAVPADSDFDSLGRMVDSLLALAPLAPDALVERRLFRLPPSSRYSESVVRQGESSAAACLRLAEAALAPDATATLGDAEAICAEAAGAGPITPAVAIAYGRLWAARGEIEDARDVLLLAADAGDERALWVLFGLWADRGLWDQSSEAFQALAAGSEVLEFASYDGIHLREPITLDDAVLTQREAAGDAMASLVLGRRDRERWIDHADAAAARVGFERITRASLYLRTFSSSLTSALLHELDEDRTLLGTAIAEGDGLAEAWRRALAGHASQRATSADLAATAGAFLLPPTAPERQAAALVALQHLKERDFELGLALSDLLAQGFQEAGAQSASVRVREILDRVVEGQRTALQAGNLRAVKDELLPLLQWLQRRGWAYGGYNIDGDDLRDAVARLRDTLTASSDPELVAMGDAFAFALYAWHVSPREGSYADDLGLTAALRASLEKLPGDGLAVAAMIASRTYSDSEERYQPSWPRGSSDEIVSDDPNRVAEAEEIAAVLDWAFARARSALLGDSLGGVRSWQAWFMSGIAQSDDDWRRASAFHLLSARAYEQAAALDPTDDQLRTNAADGYGQAFEEMLSAGTFEGALKALADLRAFAHGVPKDSEAWLTAYAWAYGGLDWLRNFPYLELFVLLARIDEAVAEDRQQGPGAHVAYKRGFAILSVLTATGWEGGLLPISANPAETECDASAGHPNDPLRLSPAVGIADIEDVAIQRCTEMIALYPDAPRFIYLTGRATLAKAIREDDAQLEREARLLYVEAARRGYPFALAGLAIEFADREDWDRAAELARAAVDRILPTVIAPVAALVLKSADDEANVMVARLLRDARELGDPFAMMVLALALDEGTIAPNSPDEAYRTALMAAARFVGPGEAAEANEAAVFVQRLGLMLDEEQRKAAKAAAAAFQPRLPTAPDLDGIEQLLREGG